MKTEAVYYNSLFKQSLQILVDESYYINTSGVNLEMIHIDQETLPTILKSAFVRNLQIYNYMYRDGVTSIFIL